MKTTLVSPHINQPCPPKLRKSGLHDIERASFVSSTSGTLISSLDKRTRQAQQDELLRLASSVGGRLHYPGGRVEVVG